MSEWGGTLRRGVVVRLASGEEVGGDLFLQQRVHHHSGPETPLDLLERGERFFPLAGPEGGVLFLGKSQVVLVRCQPIPPEAEQDRLGIDRFAELEVVMGDGQVLHGQAGISMPPTRHRALDSLNGPGHFLPLWQQDGVTYLNRAHVRLVRPIE